MKREKIIYALIAFILTIGMWLILDKWLVVLNQMGMQKSEIAIVYLACFIQCVLSYK